MAVKFSGNLPLRACDNHICRSCGLYLHQDPVYDQRKQSNIFWVGLSAVQFAEGEKMLPLAPSTRTGALIHDIQAPFLETISFYKTNLVKCVPLKHDKIRYPDNKEMEKCFSNFLWELENLKPKMVFLLGKQVANFVFKKFDAGEPELDNNFNYKPVAIGDTLFVPVHHPSFILVYKRKFIDDYISNIQTLFFLEILSSCKIA